MNYKEFFDPYEVEIYRRVKAGTMQLARLAREIAADMVGGRIYGTGKEFVHTPHGMFRMAMQNDSDNSTEQIAHQEMGAQIVVMGSRYQMREFFRMHGLHPHQSYIKWHHALKEAVSEVVH